MDEHEDDEEYRTLDPEEVQDIIEWATSASGMVVLMDNAPEHSNMEEAYERLMGYIQAIGIMMDAMPEALLEVGHKVAHDAVEDATLEEELVDQFLEEMKDL